MRWLAVALALCAAALAAAAQPARDKVDALVAAERYAEARTIAESELRNAERTTGPDSAETLSWLVRLGTIVQAQGNYPEAEKLLLRAMKTCEKRYPPDDMNIAGCAATLGALYKKQGRTAEAEVLMKRALAISERALGPDALETAFARSNVALIYVDQGRCTEAEPLLRHTLSIMETKVGASHIYAAQAAHNLALSLRCLGKFDDAEALLNRAIGTADRRSAGNRMLLAATLELLADVYDREGRYEDAEPLVRRALDILTGVLRSDHPRLIDTLTFLAQLRLRQRDIVAGEQLYDRAIAIARTTFGPDNIRTVKLNNERAIAYVVAGRCDAALPIFQTAVRNLEKIQPNDHTTAATYGSIALCETRLGNYAAAESAARRQVEISRRSLNANDPRLKWSLVHLTQALMGLKRYREAFAAIQEATTGLEDRRAAAFNAAAYGGSSLATNFEAAFRLKLALAIALAESANATEADTLRSEAFMAAQQIGLDETGQAIASAASRFAARSDGLAALLREQRDLLQRKSSFDRQYAAAVGSRDPATNRQATSLAAELTRIRARLRDIDAELRRSHTAYADLIVPRPLTPLEVRQQLGPDEAIVTLVTLNPETYVFVATRDAFEVTDIDLSNAELETAVAKLRKGLDPTGWRSLEPFDRAASYDLYRKIWQPVERTLQGKRTVFVVPTEALTSLPLGVLVTAPPAGEEGPEAMRDTAWLIKRHAMATLPSVASLKALRAYTAQQGNEPFIGFGDPALNGTPLGPATAGARSVASVYRGRHPNPDELRQLENLPAAGAELVAMAKALGASPSNDVYAKARATERGLKSLDLSRKRVIAFATHALLAGDLGLGEPGLVLTPPPNASDIDDGYLTSSEAALLNLRADWIILSACDTAAGNKPGAKGLSGLARSFFLAGARSLLVSHWPVWDDVASRLTTVSVKNFQANPQAGRADALRKAMLDVMNDKSNPRFAHPAAWAPFVLAGETKAN